MTKIQAGLFIVLVGLYSSQLFAAGVEFQQLDLDSASSFGFTVNEIGDYNADLEILNEILRNVGDFSTPEDEEVWRKTINSGWLRPGTVKILNELMKKSDPVTFDI